jgi:hypothetical protein
VNNKIKIFPYPTREFKLWFEYIVEKDRTEAIYDGMPYSSSVYYQQSSSSSPVVSDYSNAPYTLIPYSNINSVGRQWILKYFLALCKEVLGAIRQKYQTIPIPGSEVTLDGSELRSEATAEKEALITQLRENLEETTRSKMLEKQANEVEQLQKTLASVPLFIYIG